MTQRESGTYAPAADREDTARRLTREPMRDEPVATRDPHWRDEVIGAAGLNVIAGIWLILSPWILGYTGPDATWNPIVCGAIILVLALARLAKAGRHPGFERDQRADRRMALHLGLLARRLGPGKVERLDRRRDRLHHGGDRADDPRPRVISARTGCRRPRRDRRGRRRGRAGPRSSAPRRLRRTRRSRASPRGRAAGRACPRRRGRGPTDPWRRRRPHPRRRRCRDRRGRTRRRSARARVGSRRAR